MKKFCTSLREQVQDITNFEKKNVNDNKRKTKITSRCKSMLYLLKRNLKKAL